MNVPRETGTSDGHSNDTCSFYDGLAPRYHLIYPDWDQSMRRQAGMLDAVIRDTWPGASTVLDVSCGIGTQALGLAGLGYRVTASDLSAGEVERARREGVARDRDVAFSVADMRRAFAHHGRAFDVVLSADNSVPHLLADADILAAFGPVHRCTRPGGGCLVTVRDYAEEDLSRRQVKPYGVRDEAGARWLVWQVWDPHPPTYGVTLYLVEDRGEAECRTRPFRTTYYAAGIPTLMELMTRAGFADVRRLDGRYFQPMIAGRRRA